MLCKLILVSKCPAIIVKGLFKFSPCTFQVKNALVSSYSLNQKLGFNYLWIKSELNSDKNTKRENITNNNNTKDAGI